MRLPYAIAYCAGVCSTAWAGITGTPPRVPIEAVRMGIASQRVVVRTLRMPRIEKPEEIDAAIRFQAEESIPMPLEHAVLDWEVAEPSAEAIEMGQMEVVVVAGRA